MQRRHILASLGAALLVAASSGCSGSPGVPGEDPSLLLGRAWFSKKPDNPRDWVHQLVVLKRPVRGFTVQATSYKVMLELFDYERDGSRLSVTFPQDGRKGAFDYKITACELDDFDLCLELSESPWSGPKKYYAVRNADALAGDMAERAKRAMEMAGAPE